MYNNTDSVPRSDISTVLMEAIGQEKLYIGQLIYPVYPSGREVGRYPKFRIGAAELLKGGTNYGYTKRNETGTYNEIERKFEWDSFQTEEYGLEERVDDVVARRMESFFDAEVVTGKQLMNSLMIDYELQVAAATFAPLSLGGLFTTTHTSQLYIEANISGATPVNVPFDMNAAIERMTLLGEVPTTAVMSLKLWNYIRRSQLLQTYVYGYLNVNQGGSQITEQMFANVFGLQEILIAKKSVDLQPKSTSFATNITPVWPADYIALVRRAEGDFMNGGVGRTIIWDADAPGGLFTSESYRDEKRRGNVLRVRSNRILKTVSPNCVQLLDTGASGAYKT
jgi:hypothetical protein